MRAAWQILQARWPDGPGTPPAAQVHKAFAAAKKIEGLLPYMSAARCKQVEDTPA